MLFYIYLYHKRLAIRRIDEYLRVFIECHDNTPKWSQRIAIFRIVREPLATLKPEYVEFLLPVVIQFIVTIHFLFSKESKLCLYSIIPITLFLLICTLFMFLHNFNPNDTWKKVKQFKSEEDKNQDTI